MAAAVPTMSTRIFLSLPTRPLRPPDCAMHVFPDCAQHVLVLDVQPDATLKTSLWPRRASCRRTGAGRAPLVLTDVFGATPANIAQRVVEGARLAWSPASTCPCCCAVCYRSEALDALVQRAVVGGTQGDAGGRHRATEPEPQNE